MSLESITVPGAQLSGLPVFVPVLVDELELGDGVKMAEEDNWCRYGRCDRCWWLVLALKWLELRQELIECMQTRDLNKHM